MNRKLKKFATALLVVVARAVAEEILTRTLRRRGAPRQTPQRPE